jgi:hypothetical protein
MVKMLIIMYHTALCTPCIALFNCGHLHVQLKTDNEAEQVQWVFGIHKCQVVTILTFIRIKANPGALINVPCLLF